MAKKSFIIRYEPDLQKKIDKLAELSSYNESKNKGVIFAIELAHAIVKKAEAVKVNKNKYQVQAYIQERYGV